MSHVASKKNPIGNGKYYIKFPDEANKINVSHTKYLTYVGKKVKRGKFTNKKRNVRNGTQQGRKGRIHQGSSGFI